MEKKRYSELHRFTKENKIKIRFEDVFASTHHTNFCVCSHLKQRRRKTRKNFHLGLAARRKLSSSVDIKFHLLGCFCVAAYTFYCLLWRNKGINSGMSVRQK